MLDLLIDGYNLIGTAHRNLEKARNDLVQDLLQYSKRTGHRITVVFDGWKDGQIRETSTRTGSVTVVFSKFGEKADSVIKRMLTSPAARWIVVSTDREISDFAEKKDYVAVSSDEFEERLNAKLGADSNEEADIFTEDTGTLPSFRHKGGRKKLSVRDKRKIEILKKL